MLLTIFLVVGILWFLFTPTSVVVVHVAEPKDTENTDWTQ